MVVLLFLKRKMRLSERGDRILLKVTSRNAQIGSICKISIVGKRLNR
jgi:hypothetical protein